MTRNSRCPRCGGFLYRSDGDVACLLCGRSPAPPRAWEPKSPPRPIRVRSTKTRWARVKAEKAS
jgi:uncharacterized Zn finger protein (UPF0148 family)